MVIHEPQAAVSTLTSSMASAGGCIPARACDTTLLDPSMVNSLLIVPVIAAGVAETVLVVGSSLSASPSHWCCW
jgi:hypothetical protein